MANVKIYKYLPNVFALSYTVNEIYNFQIVYLQKVGHGVKISQLNHYMAYVKIYKPAIF